MKLAMHARLSWRDFGMALLFNCAITVLLSLIDYTPDFGRWAVSIAYNFIFAQSIGLSCYLLTSSLEVSRIRAKSLLALVLAGLLVLGGWLGGLTGVGILTLVFGADLSLHDLTSFLGWLSLLALFFGAIGYGYFTLREKLQRTATELAAKEVNEQRLLKLKAKAELEALQAKVNPHFLFNTLNSIASLIPVEPARAEEMVQKLSSLFRYTLDASDHNRMHLAGEIEVTRAYLEIEKIRLGDRLSYNIEFDEDLAEVEVPALLLQPLVENSVRHGISPLKSGGKIRIKCWQKDDSCHIEVWDNGRGFAGSRNGRGLGLSGVQERLALCYDDQYTLEIVDNDGVRISIVIPLPANEDGATL